HKIFSLRAQKQSKAGTHSRPCSPSRLPLRKRVGNSRAASSGANDLRTASDGLAVLEAARAYPTDIELLNLGRPRRSSYHVCRRRCMRANSPFTGPIRARVPCVARLLHARTIAEALTANEGTSHALRR